jgi:transcriptional regulator with XRE-family HTH domain
MTQTHKALRVKELRAAKAWSQEQLGKLCGLDVRTIQRIEKGEPASIESLKALASVFQCSIEDLVRPGKTSEKGKSAELPTPYLVRMTSGPDLFRLLGETHAYSLDHDAATSAEEAELVGAFLQEIQDWAEIWDEIEVAERTRAAFDFTARIQALEQSNYWVFASRLKKPMKDDNGAFEWNVLAVALRRSTNPEIINVSSKRPTVSTPRTDR